MSILDEIMIKFNAFFGEKLFLSVSKNEIYFIPTFSIIYSHSSTSFRLKIFNIEFILYIKGGMIKCDGNNDLSPEAQKKLDEFFEFVEKESQGIVN